ncbi:MAG: site-specific DNA-methyltransferase [Ignavibacteria bacterium]|jgi:DNA modification methylase|nr:site-specific DNA-methyltransferase [Ignavibacteria bacterium]
MVRDINTFTNQLYYGDNLDIMQKYIKDESIDLCYIDPPFNSNQDYNQIYNMEGKVDTAQAKAFTDTWSWTAVSINGYKEITENANKSYSLQTVLYIRSMFEILGRTGLMAYLISMTQRVQEIYRVLKPTGSFYLHCDPTASHYLKLLLDSVFISSGGKMLNEIIWNYKRWTAVSNRFQRMHDAIFYYSKSKEHIFNKLFASPSTYSTSNYGKGYQTNKINGIRQLIVYDKEKAKDKIESGKYDKIVYREGTSEVVMADVWDISIINSQAKERLGYPTQKPEALLERIIEASSNEGDLILDAFCGCGTTVAVAQRLNRNWIGIDITYQSISLILKRLEDTFGEEMINNTMLHGVPLDSASAVALAEKKDDRVRKEFEKWAVLTYSNNRAYINEKKGGDGGTDGIAFMRVSSDETKNIIFQVKTSKKLSPDVIRDLNGTIDQEKAAVGVLITLYPMDNLKKIANEYGEFENKLFGVSIPKIQIVTAVEIIAGARLKLPAVSEVLKSAQRKSNAKQTTLID